MNYLAHGLCFLDDPYFVAGTAIPDWLNVVDRRMRVRGKAAAPLIDSDDERVASIARGIVRHHDDDRWFHGTRAFAELSLRFTVAIRDSLPRDDGFRPSFLGHVLVELLLDDELARRRPGTLDRYYRALEAVCPETVQEVVNRVATRRSQRLADRIRAFCRARFLYDYADDEKLLRRLNDLMHRVKLAPLPRDFIRVLPDARRQVRRRTDELLRPESA